MNTRSQVPAALLHSTGAWQERLHLPLPQDPSTRVSLVAS